MEKSYDVDCLELAEKFLLDEGPYNKAEAAELAQAIQDAIENWFAGRSK